MMDKYDFAESVGMMHEYFIEESMPGSAQIKERIITKWSTLAAGVCLFFMAALFAWQLSHGSPVTPADSLTETDKYDVTDTETESDTADTDETTAPDPGLYEPKAEDFLTRESIITANIRASDHSKHIFLMWARLWAEAHYPQRTVADAVSLSSRLCEDTLISDNDIGLSGMCCDDVNVIFDDGGELGLSVYTMYTDMMYLSGIEERQSIDVSSSDDFMREYALGDKRFADHIRKSHYLSYSDNLKRISFPALVPGILGLGGFERPYNYNISIITDKYRSLKDGVLTVTVSANDRSLLEGYAGQMLVDIDLLGGTVSAGQYPPPEGSIDRLIHNGERYRVYIDGHFDLFIYDKETNETKMIFDSKNNHELGLEADIYEYSSVGNVFVWNERYVIFDVTGWEWHVKYVIYDIAAGTSTEYENGYETVGVYGDLLYLRPDQYYIGDSRMYYVDLSKDSGELIYDELINQYFEGDDMYMGGGYPRASVHIYGDGRYFSAVVYSNEDFSHSDIYFHDRKTGKVRSAFIDGAIVSNSPMYEGGKLLLFAGGYDLDLLTLDVD